MDLIHLVDTPEQAMAVIEDFLADDIKRSRDQRM